MKKGTCVLATKYKDGDPHDHWVVGFLRGEYKVGRQTRYDIVDSEGELFRGNGFRRIKAINQAEGDYILSQGDNAVLADSVWHVLRHFRRQRKATQ